MKKQTLKVKLQESDQRYGKQIYNSVKCIFNDYSTHLSEKKPTKINKKFGILFKILGDEVIKIPFIIFIIQSVSTTPFI